ncbi:YbaK/aminoacyl-tRNA synthetase-associated domain-containing protein [Histomonas meleagridis]|uniref:YbaK/aminoacyl-tRNA synthetase-associated domain-containing protein n=1 Tax=Histomonas meleagridis TaxID=135588 RepID=UPI0035594E45|nr:YbaK/aminoacyl-tRNA synthetase-associated domain-containing protein [Histomonas meleagridis]KAH0796620.1 YbaK/aminoacyl-tRNA synthetase-associated domain-containing protein [Histomonas meleagridis]
MLEQKIVALEKHVSELEAIVFDKKVVIPEPPFREEDHIDSGLIKMSIDKNLTGFCAARRVPSDYYEKKDLEYRRQCVGAQTIDQLTKCVIYEVQDAPKPELQYVCVMVQYNDRIDNQKLMSAISTALKTKVSQVKLAPEDIAGKLSGAEHNAMTPVYLNPRKGYEKYVIPIIMSQRIAAINPPFFWLGGGEVDVKFGIDTRKFVNIFKPIIFDISER